MRLRRRRDGDADPGVAAPAPAPTLVPAVSVVVPFWNVERYLDECLDSLASQLFTDWEAVLVDDGSPDGSRAIADAHAARDPRMRVVERPNGGLGAARNTGVGEARGRWLTFVDSDDVLPRGALGALVAAGAGSGSDVVVGAVDRTGPEGRWIPPWVDEVHAVDRRGVSLADVPGLLRNLYTWNKLYRRTFWDDAGLTFREGVAYEDQPLVTRLLGRARAIDVLTEPTYTWRLRDDESSISQQKASRRDLAERVAAWRASREALRDELSPALYDAWLATVLDVQAQWYLASPGVADDDRPGYWADLVDGVRDLLGDAPDAVWAAASPPHRVLARLALDDRRADAAAFVAAGGTAPERFAAGPTDAGGLDLRLPLRDPAAGLDAELFRLRPEQARVRHLVERIAWAGDDAEPALRVEGWAFLRHVDLGSPGVVQRVTLSLRDDTTGETVSEAAADAVPPAAMPPPVEAGTWADHRAGRFGATLPMAPLLHDGGGTGDPDVGPLTLWVRVEAAGLAGDCPVTRVVRAGGGVLVPARPVDGAARLVVRGRWGQPFRVLLEPGRGRGPRAVGPPPDGVRVDAVRSWGADPEPGGPARVRVDGVDVATGEPWHDDVDLPPGPGDHELAARDGRALHVGAHLLPLLPLALHPDAGGDAWRAGRLVRGPAGRLRLVRPEPTTGR